MLYTTQHAAVLIVFPFYLQTVTIPQTLMGREAKNPVNKTVCADNDKFSIITRWGTNIAVFVYGLRFHGSRSLEAKDAFEFSLAQQHKRNAAVCDRVALFLHSISPQHISAMRNSAGPVCKQVRMQTVSSETTVLHNLDNSATFTLTLLYLIK